MYVLCRLSAYQTSNRGVQSIYPTFQFIHPPPLFIQRKNPNPPVEIIMTKSTMKLTSTIISSHTSLAFLCVSIMIGFVFADNELGVMRSLKTAYPDWQPRGIVDVGANRGGWTTAAQEIYPGVKTFMVEATPSHTGVLEETKSKFKNIVDFEIAVLAESDGKEVNFYVEDKGFGGTGNSMFQEKSHHFEGVKPDVRITTKLDTLLNKHNMEHVDYLKLDVQVRDKLPIDYQCTAINILSD